MLQTNLIGRQFTMIGSTAKYTVVCVRAGDGCTLVIGENDEGHLLSFSYTEIKLIKPPVEVAEDLRGIL